MHYINLNIFREEYSWNDSRLNSYHMNSIYMFVTDDRIYNRGLFWGKALDPC